MARRHYEDFLAAYVEQVAPRGEAPERFHFWTAVHAVGGALRRRVWIDAGNFRWFPNFYIILVAPPGVAKKSTVINIGARLLRTVPRVNIGADMSTWQAFARNVAQAKDFLAEGGEVREGEEHLIGDALLTQTHIVTSALSMEISELGTFLDTRDDMMVSLLTELFDGKLDQRFLKATKTQGDDEIMNPFVNIIAGTTPAWMNDNFRGRIGGWGLSSRCIFIHAADGDRLIAYPHLLWGDEYDQIEESLASDLRAIATLQGAYTLSPDALAYGVEWYARHGARIKLLNSHPHRDQWLAYFLARKWDHIQKLCIVYAASRRERLTVELRDLQDAIARCDEIEDEMSHVFMSKEAVDREARVREDVWNGLCQTLRRNGPQEVYRVQGFCAQFMAGGRVNEFLKQLTDTRFLQIIEGPRYAFGDAAVVNEKKLAEAAGGVPREARAPSHETAPSPDLTREARAVTEASPEQPEQPPREARVVPQPPVPDYLAEIQRQIDRETDGY